LVISNAPNKNEYYKGRGYSGITGPYRIPILQLLLLSEFLFSKLKFESYNYGENNNRACLIPILNQELLDELSKCSISLFKSYYGYYKIEVCHTFLCLQFLSKFSITQKRPTIGTEMGHWCNNSSCCAPGHTDKMTPEQNTSMKSCYYISYEDELIKYCNCDFPNLCVPPLKHIYKEESNLTSDEIEYYRIVLLPFAGTPNSIRRYTSSFWPCTICYKTHNKFYLLWKCIQGHKKCGKDPIKYALIKDVNSILWTNALDKYNTLQPSDYEPLRLNYLQALKLEINRKKKE